MSAPFGIGLHLGKSVQISLFKECHNCGPMNAIIAQQPLELSPGLAGVVDYYFSTTRDVRQLFGEFLTNNACYTSLPLQLAEAAFNHETEWEIRRLCLLMLENLLFRMEGSVVATGRDALLALLGISTPYPELRARMSRIEHVHRAIQGDRTTAVALEDFVETSRSERKLTLARFAFKPDEVARRILSLVRRSQGDPIGSDARLSNTSSFLPAFEHFLLTLLTKDRTVYWSSDRTPTEPNALIECPENTVVIVIKPPGSDEEFEVKRTGLRADQPLTVVHERDGKPLPWGHKLQGGSLGQGIDQEIDAQCNFSRLYCDIHGKDAPICRTVSSVAIATVPSMQGQSHILDYFTNEADFGPGFSEMRHAMREVVREGSEGAACPGLPGPFGLTVEFLQKFIPRQEFLIGTTSFRLSVLSRYLGISPPPILELSGARQRRLAAAFMEEILGHFSAPNKPWVDFATYLRDSFAVPENREAANRSYLSIAEEMGRTWGTLLGSGGHSMGESFAPRNVGIRSRFIDGIWTPVVCFMDHDCLEVPDKESRTFVPLHTIVGHMQDERFLFSGNRAEKSSFQHLGLIYRVSPDIEREGAGRFQSNVQAAYQRTQALLGDLVSPFWRQSLDFWNDLVRDFLHSQAEGVGVDDWARHAQSQMENRSIEERRLRDLIVAVGRGSAFLRRYSFLFLSESAIQPSQDK